MGEKELGVRIQELGVRRKAEKANKGHAVVVYILTSNS
jgi:hypothetical protein